MKTLVRALALTMLLAIASESAAQAQPERLPLPAASAIADAKKTIGQVYQKEIAAAKTIPQRRQLARMLLQEAEKNADDPASQYAFYDLTRALAANLGDVDIGLAAVTKLGQRFKIDLPAAQAEVLRTAAPNAKTDEDLYFLEQGLDGMVTALVKTKSWQEAAEFARLGGATAKKLKDADLVKVWTDRLAEVTAREKSAGALADALAALEKSPADEAANEAAGKLLCFTYDDWAQGLSMLALSGSKTLQPVAERELKVTSAAERLAVADAWYDLAVPEKDAVVQRSLQRHALDHYRAAEAKLTGLSKARAQKRVAELFAAAMPDRIPLSALTLVEYRVHDSAMRGPFFIAEVNGRQFPRSLWAHAPNASGASVAVFDLPCEFKYLKGWCAFSFDDADPRTAVQFRANGDGKGIWNLKERLAKTKTLVPFRIELKGLRRLELIVDCPGEHHSSSSTWVSPVLQK